MELETITRKARLMAYEIAHMPFEDAVKALNAVRKEIHQASPFKKEPVDFVEWIIIDSVQANDYNPNSVAPPEMELLKDSILENGYTQPIVSWVNSEKYEVIDGFHRNRVGRECKEVNERIKNYLPLVVINEESEDRSERIAATVRHNRARGKHKIDSMSDIVLELKRRNWSDNKISKKLGMDADEVLRLCQVSGLADVFSDSDFSEAWEVGVFDENEDLLITDGDDE
jgi:ParB-like chromosome segregation protein Spo0J